MWNWPPALYVCCAVALVLFTMWLLFRKPKVERGLNSYKTMVVLGSGGHTSEMFRFLQTLPVGRKHVPRVYVIADSDTGSEATMAEFEAEKSVSPTQHSVRFVPRSRVVGQSYFTSIFTTLYSFVYSARIVWQERPKVLLANGPGTCLPLIFCAWFYRTLGIAPCTIFLLESYACVKHESLTGKLCKRIVDRYCVQWPSLLNPSLKHIKYTGRIPLHAFNGNEPKPLKDSTDVIGPPSKSYVLVTVGSTLFNSMIEALDNARFVEILKARGFDGLHVQYGKGVAPTQLKSTRGFEVVLFDYKKHGWKEEMANAGLVIGHAGAGTILDSLEASKPIIVVANDLLMSQHQTEIADVMRALGFLFSSSASNLMNDLPGLMADLPNLRVFPKSETSTFASELGKFLSAEKTTETGAEENATPKRRSARLGSR